MVDSSRRPVPVPIGQDTLNFKNDPEIMAKLEPNGKYLSLYAPNLCRVAGLLYQGAQVQQIWLQVGQIPTADDVETSKH
jgi:hypothetical protein